VGVVRREREFRCAQVIVQVFVPDGRVGQIPMRCASSSRWYVGSPR
jgi:hypothetical protein